MALPLRWAAVDTIKILNWIELSDSEQRLIGTKRKQQDGGCEEVIKTSASGGVCSTVDW